MIRPASGGMRKQVMALVKGSLQRGLAVGLVCPSNDLARLAYAAGATVFLAPIGDRPRPRDLLTMMELGAIAWRYKPDLLHLHGLRAAGLGRPVAGFLGLPAIITYHSTLACENRLRQAAIVHLERFLSRWTTKAIAVSEHVKMDVLTRLGLRPDAVTAILNGVDLASIRPKRSRAEFRGSLGLPVEALVVGTVARLAEQKDIPTLLLAAQQVLETAPGAYFILAGDGPLAATLQKMALTLGIAGQVHFLGERRDIPDLLSAIDIFLLSSRYEGAPLAAIEAMAAGRPVLATAVGGLEDIVPQGLAGFLVPAGDPSALAKELLRLIQDEELRSRLGAGARAWASEHLDQERMVSETCRVYEEVMANIQSHSTGLRK